MKNQKSYIGRGALKIFDQCHLWFGYRHFPGLVQCFTSGSVSAVLLVDFNELFSFHRCQSLFKVRRAA